MKNKKLIILIGAVYVLLMTIFTFNDLKIALWIYEPGTAYAKIFEVLGTIPMPIMGIFACVAFLMDLHYDKMIKKILMGFLIDESKLFLLYRSILDPRCDPVHVRSFYHHLCSVGRCIFLHRKKVLCIEQSRDFQESGQGAARDMRDRCDWA